MVEILDRFNSEWKRSIFCGEVTEEHVGTEVVLNGWVRKRRDLGGIIFIELWDYTSVVQIVINPEEVPQIHEKAKGLRSEFVIAVKGKVRVRPEGTENPVIKTGKYEIQVTDLNLLSPASPLPFSLSSAEGNVDENHRLRHRYLDLRRDRMQDNLRKRYKITRFTRNYFDSKKFIDVETPVLTKSTPEGARDYLVPSRVNPGNFFALPQSPQIFKQILMISGFDRYYQIVKCFRDEDLRADRQPEFTQLDIEMSFITEDDIFELMDNYMKGLIKEIKGIDVNIPFRRLSYFEAMNRYGSDKPDLRIPMEIIDVSEEFLKMDFKPFREIIESGGYVRALPLPGGAKLSRKDLNNLEEKAKDAGAGGLAPFQFKGEQLKGPLVKFMTAENMENIISKAGLNEGDALFVMADKDWKKVSDVLGRLRTDLALEYDLVNEDSWEFLWVVHFPMFEWDEEENRWSSVHHPFTAPVPEDIDILETDPGKARSRAYDLVLNGNEIGGGSIRIHDPKVQEKVFRCLQMDMDEAREKFGFLLDALASGTPPHGGIAMGLDRIAMLMSSASSIRDVIAFPKTRSAQCLMSGAPSRVDNRQLKELSLEVLEEEVEER
jgi:aspartyl-tRNA synthetase